MNIGDIVRVIRFDKTGRIVDIKLNEYNKTVYVIRYNESDTEELYEWELELM
jgi:hypothetical protein